MERVTSRDGHVVSFDRVGAGPPLVLVHGSFSDHVTNWAYVRPRLAERFTVYAVARRGRGETAAGAGDDLLAEAADVAAVVEAAAAAARAPAFLLGHSYGALCALEAALLAPEHVAKLVLYEAVRPHVASDEVMARLEDLGAREDWSALAETFLIETLGAPRAEVDALRRSPDWAAWTADARATLRDLRALRRHTVDLERARSLEVPTLLLFGTESRRERYLTDALARTLRDARVVAFEGQAHECMTTAPDVFVDTVESFLADEGSSPLSASASRGRGRGRAPRARAR